jgi:hypothetical protein
MGLATHLGPWLVGTIKNSSNTSTTVSTAQIGSYRNVGSTTAVQTSPGGVLYTTTSATTLLTPGNVIQCVGGTSSTTLTLTGTTAALKGIVSGLKVVGPGIAAGTTVSSVSGSTVTLSAAATANATSPAPFMFFDPTLGYNNNPVVLPAGAFINDIYVDVLTQFNFGAASSAAGTFTVSLLNSTATYNLATISTSGSTTAPLNVGRYNLSGATGGMVAANAIGAMLLSNISSGQNTPTDGIIQAFVTSGGTTPTLTTGMATVSIEYSVRNPDGTYYPQTQNATGGNVTY